MRRRSLRVLLRHGNARENDQEKDRVQMMRSSEMASHELSRYLSAAPLLCGRLVNSERQPGIRVLPPKRVGQTHLPLQSMHVHFPIYARTFVKITIAKAAHSESNPISPASGKELAVWGRACAISVFSAGAAAGAAATGAATCCGGASTTAVTGTSSPVGCIASSFMLFKTSAGGTVFVSIGIARTGSLTIFASSNARFFE